MIAVTAVILFIFICNKVIHYLTFVANGTYAANMLLYLVFLEIPILLGLLLPLCLYISILLSYGRLYADSEMTVMTACGMSQRQLLKITLSIAGIVAVIVAVLVLFVGPAVAKHRDDLTDIAETSTIFQTLIPGRFQASSDGKKVFYVDKLSRDRKHARNLFMAQKIENNVKHLPPSNNWIVLSAKSAYQKTDKKTGDSFMVSSDGYRYDGQPGHDDFQIIKYKEYGVRIQNPVASGHNAGEEVIPIGMLFKQARQKKGYMAELQWRLSMPLSVLILSFLALSLSRVKPRQGRFAQLLPAILIFIVYANMLVISRDWVAHGDIPAWIGVWWIHIAVFLLALVNYFRVFV